MPEYYNGVKEEINRTLDKYKTKLLNEIADVFIGKNIEKNELGNNDGVQYLRARNIGISGIKQSDIFVDEKYIRKYAKYILQSGDILLTRCFGQLKYVQVKDSDLPAIASVGLIVIRTVDVPEEYLYSYLTSETGKEIFKKQISLIKKGQTIEFIGINELKKLKIPIFDEKTMIEISKTEDGL